MRRQSKYYAELFVRTAEEVGARGIDELSVHFVRLLARENALSRFHEIRRLIDSALDRASGSVSVTVTTATALSPSVTKTLEKAATAAGFNGIQTVVDPEIIGGAVMRAGDRRIDQSVRGALSRLYESLTS